MKKYHQSPIFGVRSGRSNCTPYVDERNSHDVPVTKYDMIRRSPILAVKAPRQIIARPTPFVSLPGVRVCRSWHNRISGGSSSAGYNERYEANERARIDFIGLFSIALAIANRIAQLVKTLVGRPMHVAMVSGLKRYAAPMGKLSHFISFLGDMNCLELVDWPESAIWIIASAQRMSRKT